MKTTVALSGRIFSAARAARTPSAAVANEIYAAPRAARTPSAAGNAASKAASKAKQGKGKAKGKKGKAKVKKGKGKAKGKKGKGKAKARPIAASSKAKGKVKRATVVRSCRKCTYQFGGDLICPLCHTHALRSAVKRKLEETEHGERDLTHRREAARSTGGHSVKRQKPQAPPAPERKKPRPKYTTSEYRGVSYRHDCSLPWGARVGSGKRGTQRWVGRFSTELDAARAYDAAAKEAYGVNAHLNFPGAKSGPKTCSHCGATSTPCWRRGEGATPLCNACGLFWTKHKQPRPHE